MMLRQSSYPSFGMNFWKSGGGWTRRWLYLKSSTEAPALNTDSPSRNRSSVEEADVMSNAGQSPHIVKDFTVGNTRIKIADDCCRDKTPEDVQRILREIAQMAQAAITAATLAAE